jgi:tRNA (guanine37-N1)-methyltransferase
MVFHIITIFPDIFSSYFNQSIIKRAQMSGIIKIKIYNLRDWTEDKHKTVDDAPYGGGAGMVIKIEPLYRSIMDIKERIKSGSVKTVLLSAKGKTWNQKLAHVYSHLDHVILICGRYEGVDERILNFVNEEISIGDYVLTGGEIPAMVIVDSVTRLLPGVLGNAESLRDESHSSPGYLSTPQYTRPEVFVDNNGRKYSVPKILLSGNHEEIKKWRRAKSKN